MSEFAWDPATYLETMRQEVPGWSALQLHVTAATSHPTVGTILELGVGTGETARRVLAVTRRDARLHGIDSSAEMLAAARRVLPAERVTLTLSRLQDPLPDGPFDRVVSALAVHHLSGPEKAELFRRVAGVLGPGGRFVLGDLIVPADPADVRTEIDGVYDTPSSLAQQLQWLAAAGLDAKPAWVDRDLAVIVAKAPPSVAGNARPAGGCCPLNQPIATG